MVLLPLWCCGLQVTVLGVRRLSGLPLTPVVEPQLLFTVDDLSFTSPRSRRPTRTDPNYLWRKVIALPNWSNDSVWPERYE
jgi:hypothetical protein